MPSLFPSTGVNRVVVRYVLRALVVSAFLSGVLGCERGTRTVSTSRFGDVALFGDLSSPKHLVLYVSDSVPLRDPERSMVGALAENHVAVAVVDVDRYLASLSSDHSECHYLAGELERLSQVLQNVRHFDHLVPTVVGGRGRGASIAYGAFVQHPASFVGLLTFDLCPSLPFEPPLCDGKSDHSTPPELVGESITAPWLNAHLVGASERCTAHYHDRFQTNSGVLPAVPMMGENLAIDRTTLGKFNTFITPPVRIRNELPEELVSLPIREISVGIPTSEYLAIIYSGDGGWGATEEMIARRFADKGFAVVGLDTLRYYWKARSAEESANHLAQVSRYYMNRYGKRRIVTVGYSYGADLLPFLVNRLHTSIRERIALVTLLNPSDGTAFRAKLNDWVVSPSAEVNELPLLPEIQRLSPLRLLCMYSASDQESLCRLALNGIHIRAFAGGHEFAGREGQLVDQMIMSLRGDEPGALGVSFGEATQAGTPRSTGESR